VRAGAPHRHDRQIELEVEPRPPSDARLDLQIRLHRGAQLAADRETESRLREELAAAARFFAQRLKQRRDLFGGNATARVAHRELEDRKSTRLNSSHRTISYAVFCLKKKKKDY